MSSESDHPSSAQVIVSDPQAVPALAEYFESAGLETGPLIGTSFSISGPRGRFEALFGATADAAGGGEQAAELPLDGLPEELAASVEAVAVPGPPDFGPTSP